MSNENKTQGQLLEEQLLMAPKNGGESLAAEEIAKADAFCEGYKACLLYTSGKIAFLKDYAARKKKEVAHRGEER